MKGACCTVGANIITRAGRMDATGIVLPFILGTSKTHFARHASMSFQKESCIIRIGFKPPNVRLCLAMMICERENDFIKVSSAVLAP